MIGGLKNVNIHTLMLKRGTKLCSLLFILFTLAHIAHWCERRKASQSAFQHIYLVIKFKPNMELDISRTGLLAQW